MSRVSVWSTCQACWFQVVLASQMHLSILHVEHGKAVARSLECLVVGRQPDLYRPLDHMATGQALQSLQAAVAHLGYLNSSPCMGSICAAHDCRKQQAVQAQSQRQAACQMIAVHLRARASTREPPDPRLPGGQGVRGQGPFLKG
jgi:hypothetical protein